MSLEGPGPATRPPLPRAPGAPPFVTAPIISRPDLQLQKMLSILDRICPPSTWQFVTSAGVEVSAGCPKLPGLAANVAVGCFYVKEDSNPTVYKLLYAGLGTGIGWGLPASISGSTASMPSGGIGKIRRGPHSRSRLKPHDFMGRCAIDEYSAAVVVGGGLSIIFFGASPALIRLLGPGFLEAHFASQLSCRAVGILRGISVGIQAGLGGTVYNGSVVRVVP